MNRETAVSRTFPAHPSALSEIRTWVRTQAGRCSLPSETMEELALAANEAAANALLHSGTRRIEVRWRAGDGLINVEVVDEGVFRRRVRLSEVEGPGGYGIPLMMSLADEVEIREGTEREPGTVVRLVKKLQP
jgi:anti-sigma regulatory factor (Ser/Thr protein kinase)